MEESGFGFSKAGETRRAIAIAPWNRLEGAIPLLCDPIKSRRQLQDKLFNPTTQLIGSKKIYCFKRILLSNFIRPFQDCTLLTLLQLETDNAIFAMDKIGHSVEVWLKLYFQTATRQQHPILSIRKVVDTFVSYPSR